MEMVAFLTKQFSPFVRKPFLRLWQPVLLMTFFLYLVSVSHAADVTLSWDASAEPNIAGYKIYYKTGSNEPPFGGKGASEGNSPLDVGNKTTFTLTGLEDTQAYHFVVTAYDTAGIESGYSNVVRFQYRTTNHIDPAGGGGNADENFEGPSVPVRLPSGTVLQLNQKQVEAIKGERGVFFGAEAAEMLGPGEVVVSLPAELGGGYIYGRPEHLAQAFAAAGATQGTTPATHLFVKRSSCLWF